MVLLDGIVLGPVAITRSRVVLVIPLEVCCTGKQVSDYQKKSPMNLWGSWGHKNPAIPTFALLALSSAQKA